MFTTTQLDRYADVLLWGLKTSRKGRRKKSEMILIRYNLPAVNLAEILQAKLLDMGMNPVLRADATPTMERNFFEIANQRQLTFQPAGEKESRPDGTPLMPRGQLRKPSSRWSCIHNELDPSENESR